MADLIQCPKCGLRQSSRHAYCARCEYQFTGSPDESVVDDGTPTSDTPTGSGPTPTDQGIDVFADLPSGEMGASDSGSWRADSAPPRSESIRASRGDRLVEDRGSLGRRLSEPHSVPLDDEQAPTEEYPAAPSWQMPSRVGSLPGGRPASTPGEAWPPAPGDVTNSGSVPGFLLRGRPNSDLYATEHSVPPQDPLMADLVAGRVQTEQPREDFSPTVADEPPIHPTFGDAPSPAGPFAELPPEHTWEQADSDEIPAVWTDEGFPAVEGGPRVVPPGRGARRYSASRRRDPRGRAVATHPDAFQAGSVPQDGPRPRLTGERVPAVFPPPPEEQEYADQPAVAPPPPPPPRRRTSPGAAAPPVRPPPPAAPPPRPATTPGRPAPAPPSPRPSQGTGLPPGAGRAIAIGAALLLLVAGFNTMSMFRSRSALTRALDIGIGPNGPTPDLPHVLRQRIAELDLEGSVEAFHSEIAGSSDSYRVGVHMQSRIAGYPVGWEAIREGSFKVDKRIRALQVYVSAGWELDSDALERLTVYNRERKAAREAARAPKPPPVIGDDDDSAQPEGEPVEGAPEGAEPAESATPAQDGE